MATFLAAALAIISLLSALLLTVVILMQNPKGAGGLGALGGGVSEAMFGASASNTLVKITVGLAVLFLVATLLSSVFAGHSSSKKSILEETLKQQTTEAAVAAPAAPAAEPAPAAPAAPAAEPAPAAK